MLLYAHGIYAYMAYTHDTHIIRCSKLLSGEARSSVSRTDEDPINYNRPCLLVIGCHRHWRHHHHHRLRHRLPHSDHHSSSSSLSLSVKSTTPTTGWPARQPDQFGFDQFCIGIIWILGEYCGPVVWVGEPDKEQ